MKRDILLFNEFFIIKENGMIQEPRNLVSSSEFEEDNIDYTFLYKTDDLDITNYEDISNKELLEYVSMNDISEVLPYTNEKVFIDDYDVKSYTNNENFVIEFLSEFYIFGEKENVNEDGGVAYANAANTSGMGAVITPVASSIPGQTVGADFASNGGVVGSGDIGVAFNRNISKRPTRSRRKQKAMGALKMFKGYSNLIESVREDMFKLYPFLSEMEYSEKDDIYTYKKDDISAKLVFGEKDEKWYIKFNYKDCSGNITHIYNLNEKNISFQQLKNCLTTIETKYFKTF